MTKHKILIAMSGGVDSSVAAALLKEAGHEVAGATIRTWAPNDCADKNTKTCCGITGVEDAREVADALEIPYWVFNFEKEFRERVVDHFASEYLKGRTPNPCISCNEHIKFRLFYHRAKQLGYDYIATGHYAQLVRNENSDSFYISEGRDTGKDQSYVLFPLDQEILKHLYLPIGGFTKAEIRAKAREIKLGVANKPDSQEICFIPSNDYGNFLHKQYERAGRQTEKGVIRTKEGKVLGEHEGFFHYTRGQRRGLGVAHTERLYVIETIPETNEVVVGTKDDVAGIFCTVGRINWFLKPDFSSPAKAHVKIRSQHQKAAAELSLLEDGRVRVEFEDAQDAITSGQAAVFYQGQNVIGGGWIDEIR